MSEKKKPAATAIPTDRIEVKATPTMYEGETITRRAYTITDNQGNMVQYGTHMKPGVYKLKPYYGHVLQCEMEERNIDILVDNVLARAQRRGQQVDVRDFMQVTVNEKEKKISLVLPRDTLVDLCKSPQSKGVMPPGGAEEAELVTLLIASSKKGTLPSRSIIDEQQNRLTQTPQGAQYFRYGVKDAQCNVSPTRFEELWKQMQISGLNLDWKTVVDAGGHKVQKVDVYSSPPNLPKLCPAGKPGAKR